MVKKGTKKPRKLAKSDRFPLIEKELHKRTKAELVAMILAIAKEHAVVARELEDRLTDRKAGGSARRRRVVRHRSCDRFR